MSARRALSAHAMRARALLTGAALGGHAAAVVVVAAFFLARGPASGLSAAAAAVLVLAFNIIGLAVQIALADAKPTVMMIATLSSYIVRVSALGVVLMFALANEDKFTAMDTTALAVSAIAVEVSWLVAEYWVFSRLRIPVFDPPAE